MTFMTYSTNKKYSPLWKDCVLTAHATDTVMLLHSQLDWHYCRIIDVFFYNICVVSLGQS